MTYPRLEIFLSDPAHVTFVHHVTPGQRPLDVPVELTELTKGGFAEAQRKLGDFVFQVLLHWHPSQFAALNAPVTAEDEPKTDRDVVEMLLRESLGRRTAEHIPTIELILHNASTGIEACEAFRTSEWPELKARLERYRPRR